MKIQPSSSSKPAAPAGRANRAARSTNARRSQGSQQDAIELSAQGRKVLDIPQNQRDRAQLVARLRGEVDAGTYRPDPDAVAQRLADRLGQ